MDREDIGSTPRRRKCGRGYPRIRFGDARGDSIAEVERDDPRLSDVFKQCLARGGQVVFGKYTDSDAAEVASITLQREPLHGRNTVAKHTSAKEILL